MNDNTICLEQSEDAILAYEISDEALEIAAGTGKAAVTFGVCTATASCPD